MHLRIMDIASVSLVGTRGHNVQGPVLNKSQGEGQGHNQSACR